MKRQQDKDFAVKSSRTRCIHLCDDNGNRDHKNADSRRREGRSTVNQSMGRDGKGHRDRDRDRAFESDFERMIKRHKDLRTMDHPFPHGQRSDRGSQGPEYRALCVSNLNDNVSDGSIKEALIKEFKKFGEFNINIVHNGEHRIAFMNFTFSEDARDAKHARGNKLILFDRPCRVEPVIKSFKRQRSLSPLDYVPRDTFQNNPDSPLHISGSRRSNRHDSMGRESGQHVQRHRDFHFENRGRQGPHEKFPHHLQHVLPEDDDKATRTLFVGNLDSNVDEGELRRIFERYGVVEDIDIKQKKAGSGNAYAFVMFLNLDMAHRAKVDMSGKLIGKFQCKIGYGKATPSTCLWVGGLGPWIRTETLEREFDRFGVIHRIEWPQGKTYAYVLYDSIDAAQAACTEMRGFPLGGQDRRLRVDFADANHIESQEGRLHNETLGGSFSSSEQKQDHDSPGQSRGSFDNQWHCGNKGYMDGSNKGNSRKDWPSERVDDYRNPDNPHDVEFGEPFRRERNGERSDTRERKKFRSSYEDERIYQGHSFGRSSHCNDFGVPDRHQDHYMNNFRRSHSPHRHHRQSDEHDWVSFDRNPHNYSPSLQQTTHSEFVHNHGSFLQLASVAHVENIVDLAKCLPIVWSGALVLKTSAFAARMHLVSGDVSLVDTLMRDPTTTEMAVLKITQRLRLDQAKLEEVGKRVSISGPHGHAVLLAMPGLTQALEDSNTNVQQRPLRNLVSYLKQKGAAGVISLPPNPGKEKDNFGVLHAFPPCQFGHEFLAKCAPKLRIDPQREEHLVVVVVRGVMNVN